MFVQWLLLDRYLIEFNSQSFFFFLLPPIVFASAYTLKKKNFVRHISYILGLGVLGTIVAMTVLTLILNYGNELYRDPVTGESWVDPAECMLLAAVLASTDTVAVLTLITADKYLVLNAVLFGEGVVNDAVTILLYQAVDREIQKAEVATNHGIEDGAPGHKDITLGRKEISGMIINFFSLSIRSIIMGALVGLLVSYVLKVFNLNYDPIKETTIMIMFAYLSYLFAEQTALSGIISMFSCGLFMAHYAYWNISKKARVGTEMAVCTIANCNQSFLYIYMGLSAFSIEMEYVHMNMVYTTLIAIFVCRIFSVGVPIFLVWLSTGMKPLQLKWNEWVFVYCGGLIRGAIAFGLGLQMTTDNNKVLKNTVQICALVTIVGVGAPI
jgi:solute carrier family 9 (sodium/hydrogen exchanger), member 6/7